MRPAPETGTTVYGPTAIPVRRIGSDDEPEVLVGVTELGASLVLTVPDGPASRLGPQGRSFIVTSEHHNSSQNAGFLLNVAHWLTGLLGD